MLELVGIVLVVVPALYYAVYGLIIKRLATRPPNWSPDKAFTPFVSVIIPTFNERKTIEERVKNLDQLDYPTSSLEVIFVDGASNDGTPQIIDKLRTSMPFVHLLQQPTREGYNSAVHEGICKASSNVIVMADAGSMFHPRAISSIVRNLADPKVGAATGKAVFHNPNESLATRLEAVFRSNNDQLRIAESNIDSTVDMKGELLAFRKDVGLMLRPHENLPDTAAFDTSIGYMSRHRGYRAVFDPEAIFYEYAPSTLRERLKVQLTRGTTFTGALWQFKTMVLNPKFGSYGLIILPSRFLMLIVFPWMLLSAPFVLIWETLVQPTVAPITLAFMGLVGLLLLHPKTRIAFLSFSLSQFILVIVTLRLLLKRHTHFIHTAQTTRR